MDNRPTTVLHLITTLEIGGAEMMLWKLLSFMDKEVLSNHVVCLTNMGPIGERIVSLGISVHFLNMPEGRITVKGMVRLWQLFRSIRPAVLQTWLYHADLLGLIFGKLASVNRIYWNIRCSYMKLDNYRFSTRLTRIICSLLSPLPDAVLTNSKQAMIYHRAVGYKPKRWKVIPNGFDISRFRPDGNAKPRVLKELKLPDTDSNPDARTGYPLLIGLIARYDPMKGHKSFIKAACRLLRDRMDVHFILAGKGVEWENPGLVHHIPMTLRKYFHLLGQRTDIPNITAALDIATSASLGEGFSNTIGEAMACGVPCVVTNVGDSPYIIGDTGLVVPLQDPGAMAEAWAQILALDGKDRLELGVSARERIVLNFSIERIAKEYENIYAGSPERIG
ncbi:MAG: glycosyltransferase [Deltaproteobacteria bacterium]|nr:glycosyltransferase [Deltaproteobacteria bacterium]